jgi:iron(III) transport system substrate-binding protein
LSASVILPVSSIVQAPDRLAALFLTLLAFPKTTCEAGSQGHALTTHARSHDEETVSALLACASWVVAAPAAFAQSRTLAEIADYQGPDRLQTLIEGARKEGSLSLYTSRVAEDMTPVIEAFTRKYGVEVQVWRGSNRAVLQRVVQERRAGRCAADVVSSGTPSLEPLHREQLLQRCAHPP